jgi:hypothetical protein
VELKSVLKKLEQSKEFMAWNKESPDTYLSYAFKTIENDKESFWQFGFYRKSTDKITTFIINDDCIEMQPEEEIFKKPDMEVKPLSIDNAKIALKEILKKTKEFQKENYPKELVNKTIAILQNMDEFGNIWNITYITHSFKTLNMKVNPENGEILSHNLASLMDFIKK